MRWLVWPLPALLSWTAAWLVFVACQPLGQGVALGLAALVAAGLALLHTSRWRRVIVGLGFPLSVLTLSASWPAWAWLLPCILLALVYPASSWRDAPLFPTPPQALAGLAAKAPLAPSAAVLDVGCGLGHGLRELRSAYPEARLEGIEWSRPLAWLCSRLCPFARVRRGDMWQLDWSGYAMVYVFQRPESMQRVWAKACHELGPQAWLVSLDFPVAGVDAFAQLNLSRGHTLWIYKPAKSAQLAG